MTPWRIHLAGFIWNDALEHGKTVRDYGEFTDPRPFLESHAQITKWMAAIIP